ncbi:MAG: hypothetical protein ACR2N1_08160 [Rubripirellula sp.]
MSFRNFQFAKRFRRFLANEFQAGNAIENHDVPLDANQPSPKGYGLELDISNLRSEDALIVPNSGLARTRWMGVA